MLAAASERQDAAGNYSAGLGRKKRPSLILALSASLVCGLGITGLTGCSSSTPAVGSAKASASSSADTYELPQTWPLTGLLCDDEAAAQNRPSVSAKVENSMDARPQSGLEEADMVWEEMIEGGYTRFNAVFQSHTPAEVGPIRSVRPMDVPISKPLGGMLVYSGGIDYFEQMVANAGIQGHNEDTSIGSTYRVNFRYMPHNLYLNVGDMITRYGGNLTGPKPQFKFSLPPGSEPAPKELEGGDNWRPVDSTAASKGSQVNAINCNFPSVQAGWTWGGTRYQRFDNGAQNVSRAGVPLEADNVIILMVKTHATGFTDPAGAPVIETTLVDSGQGYVASGGKVVPIEWSKMADEEPLEITHEGETVYLHPGQTWIEMVPVDGGSVTFDPALPPADNNKQ